MAKTLTLLLLLALGTSCTDHASISSVPTPSNNQNPSPPIGGDTEILQPGGTSAGQSASANPSDDAPGNGAGQGSGNNTLGDGGSTHGAGNGPGTGGAGGAAPVPEPATVFLVGSGLAGAALMRRRKVAGEIQTEDT